MMNKKKHMSATKTLANDAKDTSMYYKSKIKHLYKSQISGKECLARTINGNKYVRNLRTTKLYDWTSVDKYTWGDWLK